MVLVLGGIDYFTAGIDLVVIFPHIHVLLLGPLSLGVVSVSWMLVGSLIVAIVVI